MGRITGPPPLPGINFSERENDWNCSGSIGDIFILAPYNYQSANLITANLSSSLSCTKCVISLPKLARDKFTVPNLKTSSKFRRTSRLLYLLWNNNSAEPLIWSTITKQPNQKLVSIARNHELDYQNACPWKNRDSWPPEIHRCSLLLIQKAK